MVSSFSGCKYHRPFSRACSDLRRIHATVRDFGPPLLCREVPQAAGGRGTRIRSKSAQRAGLNGVAVARRRGVEPPTSGSTVRYSNQLRYRPAGTACGARRITSLSSPAGEPGEARPPSPSIKRRVGCADPYTTR